MARSSRGSTTHAAAVRNSLTLIEAARAAGVRRIVHVSIANPDASSKLPYYSGKAEVEAALTASGVGYAILRPAVLFGDEPILVNNIAWLLRRFPIFAIPGSGGYRIQPIHVADLADLAVQFAAQSGNVVADAAGPETFDFTEFVGLIRGSVGSRALIVHGPPGLALFAARLLGWSLHDVLLTRDELDGLMADLLISHSLPLGRTSFTAWLTEASSWLGGSYLSEVKRHFPPPKE
jgi:NADH dehydrogenase